ncbi:MAG: 5-dehydro-2-deoxygluconokinase [Alphaproteobacteria bacterium MarineAlpha6_Bin2]|jgi:sugar/nucleoside kinase (ribokinase family)|nr:MAG: 5-dehydro-2-deoxygluconokinase [Alphaproteobacteria bacterium MarineAlpha6_Bin2]
MQQFDLLGIGNAVVDVLYETDEEFIKNNQLEKGIMTLIDEEKAEKFYSSLKQGIEVSGGSVANTTVGFASLSGKPAFIGKVKDDKLGKTFSQSLTSAGVLFKTEPIINGPGTARSFIFVTPDAHRTMNTYIGACSLLSPKDIDDQIIKNSKIIFLEGYVWEENLAKESLVKAAEIARKANNKVALTLSDPFCVKKHRSEFEELIKKHIDILFANEFEAKELCQTQDLEESAKEISNMTEIAVVTRSEKGAKIYNAKETIEIKAKVFNAVKDTTGAGDLFAAGFLYGLSKKFSILKSGNIAAITAGEIISHFGARPETNLSNLIQKELTD